MHTRERLLRQLDTAWREFQESYAGLSEAEMLDPSVAGAWSVKDVIAHVTSWEEEALTHLPEIVAGRRPPRYSVTHGGIDAFNAATMALRKQLSFRAVLEQQAAVHARLIALLESAPEEDLRPDARFRRRLRLDTCGHYAKHAAAIRRWRARRDDNKPAW